MDTATVAIIFSATGGACELAGLFFVVREIALDREQARTLLAPTPWPKAPKRDYPVEVSRGAGVALPHWARRMGEGQQLSAVIEYVDRLERSAANGFLNMRKAIDQERDELEEALHGEMATADERLRQNLLYVLTGSIRGRIIGTRLLVFGIVLGVVGSALGAAS